MHLKQGNGHWKILSCFWSRHPVPNLPSSSSSLLFPLSTSSLSLSLRQQGEEGGGQKREVPISKSPNCPFHPKLFPPSDFFFPQEIRPSEKNCETERRRSSLPLQNNWKCLGNGKSYWLAPPKLVELYSTSSGWKKMKYNFPEWMSPTPPFLPSFIPWRYKGRFPKSQRRFFP